MEASTWLKKGFQENKLNYVQNIYPKSMQIQISKNHPSKFLSIMFIVMSTTFLNVHFQTGLVFEDLGANITGKLIIHTTVLVLFVNF